jgi:hypothetical protein
LVGIGASTVVCTGARDGAMTQIQVLSSPERRRRWSTEQKRSIIQNAGTPSRLRFARTRRDEGGIEPPVANLPLDLRSILAMIVPVVVGPLAGHRTPSRFRYRGPFVASKYCESTTHPVYHAKITVSTKNFPRSEGRKCGVKGLVQWRGLTVWSRSWSRTAGKGRERVRVYGILEFTTTW